MARFFAAGGNIGKGVAVISGADAEHMKVLRMKVGERLVVCDGAGTDHHCVIRRIRDREVEAEILGAERCKAEPSLACKVLAGLPKGERADYLVQKCAEAGAFEIAFFVSARCVARPVPGSEGKKTARWQRIAEEAAKQSGRGIVPKVFLLSSLAEALDAAAKTELRLFMYEIGERVPLREVVEAAGSFKTASVITGPEGGFEPFEADLAKAAGCRLCSMGARILRCETAPVVALSALMYATGNL